VGHPKKGYPFNSATSDIIIPLFTEIKNQNPKKEGIKMPKLTYPHVGHENHLCYLHNLGILEADLAHYKDLVQGARFICRKCGRAAKNAESLCEPEKL
jgi:hypothetical protein